MVSIADGADTIKVIPCRCPNIASSKTCKRPNWSDSSHWHCPKCLIRSSNRVKFLSHVLACDMPMLNWNSVWAVDDGGNLVRHTQEGVDEFHLLADSPSDAVDNGRNGILDNGNGVVFNPTDPLVNDPALTH